MKFRARSSVASQAFRSRCACWGPFEDSEGLASHFDGGANRLADTKRIKRLRVDLLTSCAKVLREATGFKPQFLVGLGQGGLVAAVLRWPLVVELTLQARNLQRTEARAAGEAWAGIKAIWSVRPRLWRTQSGHQEIAESCPELQKDFPEPPLRGFGVVGKIAAGDEVLRSLRLDGSKGIEESSIRGMLSEPSREMWDHDGLCACGKRTYLFSRCPSCIEQEALDTAVEIAEREDAEVRGSPDRDPESPEVGVEVNGVLAARERAGGRAGSSLFGRPVMGGGLPAIAQGRGCPDFVRKPQGQALEGWVASHPQPRHFYTDQLKYITAWVAVLNRLIHALKGNTLPAVLVELIGGEATFAVEGKRSRAMHKVWIRLDSRQSACGCRAYLQEGTCGHCDAAVQAAVQMGLVRPEQAAAAPEGSHPAELSSRVIKGACRLARQGVLQWLGSQEPRA